MANEKNLKPFKKGDDPRRKKNPRKGVVSVVTAVKNFLNEVANDGEEYQKKLGKAIVLRAITKSDKLAEAIMDRTDGKVAQGVNLGDKDGNPLVIQISQEIAEKNNVFTPSTKRNRKRPSPV